MTHTFTPPTHYKNGSNLFTPPIAGDTPDWQREPAIYLTSDTPIAINVWLWTDNTINETQPPLKDARTNPDGTITPGYKKVWGGGRTHDISDGEYEMLLGAGYSANLT